MEINKEYLLTFQSFEDEESYRSSPSLNYSTLKAFASNPSVLSGDIPQIKSSALYIGDFVDKYFTDRDALYNIYAVESSIEPMSDSISKLYDAFVETGNFHPSRQDAIGKARELGLWSSIKDDDKVSSRITDTLFTNLENAESTIGKVILPKDDYFKAMCSINNILSSEDAMALISETDGIFVVDQFKWEFELQLNSGNKRIFRVMFDKLKFDTINKKIIGIDIKSGAVPCVDFGNQFLKYRYDIQGILYLFGIMALRHKYFPEWSHVLPEDFKFLYSPKIDHKKPIIVSLDEKFIASDEEYLIHDGKRIDGFWKILNDVDWHLDNMEYSDNRLLVENNFKLNISQLI